MLRSPYRTAPPLWLLLSLAVLQIAGCAYLGAAKALASEAGRPKHEVGTLTRADVVARPGINQVYGKLPMGFEVNRGQTDAKVRFLSRGRGYTLFLTSTEVVLLLQNRLISHRLHLAN